MGFKLQDFVFKIGDVGVAQSDDPGGTFVTVTGAMDPGYGATIVSLANIQGRAGGLALGGSVTIVPVGPDTNTWSVSVGYISTDTYPIASGQEVLRVTAVVAY